MKVLPLPCRWIDAFAWLGRPRKMAVGSPVGDVNSVPNYYFRAKYIDTQIKCIFFVLKYQ